ncbi:hypothetical protein HL653_22930 [Sphingomonas sp. AP4-R1]|uniref:hypothetical protein n=1 Tax=Sphingomonas sp. AP4-R1 TaxID=2735134 RepID=UPI00149344B2|nr:hypothetical protein [Sphingomonas sp. AP4-R1]QJU60213.1 hypothetical protein HL653_22930 [Sphingomonas sp. AP4-R1]
MAVSKCEHDYACRNISKCLDIVLRGHQDIRTDLSLGAMAGLIFLCDSYFEGEALILWQSIHERLSRKCDPTFGVYGASIKTMRIETALEIVSDLRKLELLIGGPTRGGS